MRIEEKGIAKSRKRRSYYEIWMQENKEREKKERTKLCGIGEKW